MACSEPLTVLARRDARRLQEQPTERTLIGIPDSIGDAIDTYLCSLQQTFRSLDPSIL